VRLGDFELDNTLDAIRRFVAFAFGSTQNYLHHRPDAKLDEAIPRVVFEGRDYIAIARLASETRNDLPDRRAATIEVAYDHHITLKSDAKVLVLPDALIEDIPEGRALRQRAHELDITLATYAWDETEPPNMHISTVHSIIRAHLRVEYEG
jgi:hypothetical protein